MEKKEGVEVGEEEWGSKGCGDGWKDGRKMGGGVTKRWGEMM